MANNTATMEMYPTWPDRAVIFIQAFASSAAVQSVSITGPGITTPVIAKSDPSQPLGTQFLNYQINYDFPTTNPNLTYTATITYNNGTPSSVLGISNSINMSNKMVGSVAISNDGGSDQDYNDCVVQIYAFGNSTD